MKTPAEPGDELLQSLAEETGALPQAAAAHVRARQRVRGKTVTATLAIALLAVGVWLLPNVSRNKTANSPARSVMPPKVAKTMTAQGYFRIHPAGEAALPDAIPSGVSEREKKLLTELAGIPLLIVKNRAGEVTRVHIFDR